MDYALMHSIATVAAMMAFAAVCWWAYRPANRARFEADGRLPLDNDPILMAPPRKAAPSAEHTLASGQHAATSAEKGE